MAIKLSLGRLKLQMGFEELVLVTCDDFASDYGAPVLWCAAAPLFRMWHRRPACVWRWRGNLIDGQVAASLLLALA